MSFAKRAFSGSVLALTTVALLGAAGWRLHSAMNQTEQSNRPPARERFYTVEVGVLAPQRVSPTITAFGQIQTWNSLEIRAPASGPITEISPNFRDGLAVEAGELLFRIDPELAERRVIDAKAGLAQAATELQEASLSLKHVKSEIAAAEAQASVRRNDLARKKSLLAKKLTTSTAVDDATLSYSAAEQAVVAKQQALLAMQSRIDKAEAGVERARLTLNDSERALQDTTYRAPFAGRLTDVTVTLGRRLSQNEKLALLIDPSALEVAFPVRNSDFGRLLDPANHSKLAPLAVQITLDLSGSEISVDGVLDRPAAVATSQAGRTVYARLKAPKQTALRPGDFVTVTITEPDLTNVAMIPAAAATNDGNILLVGEGGRLVEHQAEILRRQGDNLILANVPFDQQYVRLRLPFLAAGVKVKPRDTSQPAADGALASAKGAASKPDSMTETASTTAEGVALDDAKRAILVSYVKTNNRMPDDRRAAVLEELSKVAPSRETIERIERQMARRGNRS